MKKIFLIIILNSLFVILNSHPVLATDYYVSPTGSDINAGTQSFPWKTIQKAAGTLAAGDTVLIRGGEYLITNKDNPITVANSGTPTQYITFQAYPGETVTIRGNYPTLGDPVWYGILIAGKSYIKIEGLTFKGFHAAVGCKAPGHHIIIHRNVATYNSQSGISSSGAISGTLETCDYLTIEENVIHHNGYYESGTPAIGQYEGWGSGISINPHRQPYAFDSDYSHFHSAIRGNYIYHNYDGTGGIAGGTAPHTDGNGIIIDLGGNIPPVLIANNVVFDNGGRCVHLYGSQNVWIVGNTCYMNNFDTNFGTYSNTQAEIGGYAAQGNSLPLINIHTLNNLVYAAPGRQITFFPDIAASELTMSNNLWFGTPYRETYSPYGANFIKSNPQLINASIDPSVADFHLSLTSPAIDTGINVGLPYNGLAPDIGAYETGGTTPIPGDLNSDGHVDILDLRYTITNFAGIFNLNTVIANFGK